MQEMAFVWVLAEAVEVVKKRWRKVELVENSKQEIWDWVVLNGSMQVVSEDVDETGNDGNRMSDVLFVLLLMEDTKDL